MIHCLLDEYRFYNQYPEKQLNIISTLFGQIINNRLIDGIIETIALKYVLEGIKKGNGPLFIFGTKALEQFKDKLNEFPTYTKTLIEAKQLKNDPLLYEAVLEKLEDSFGDWFDGKFELPTMTNNLYPYKNLFAPIKINSIEILIIRKRTFIISFFPKRKAIHKIIVLLK